MKSPYNICTIIPCYNEGKRLDIQGFLDFFIDCPRKWHFLFVNDGSTDNTASVLEELRSKYPEMVSTISLENNSGKAEAIRQGMLSIAEKKGFDYVGFMDADLSTPLSEIHQIDQAIDTFLKPSMIIGSRVKLHGSTVINRSNRRHYVGRIIATMISKTLKLAIYDTQCGFKYIRIDLLEYLFEEAFISRWLFDVELIFRLLKDTGPLAIENELYELPVQRWDEKGDSKIPLSYAFRIPLELRRIQKRYQ